MTIIYRNVGNNWLLASTERLQVGADVSVSKKDGTTKTEKVGALVEATGFEFRYAIDRAARAPQVVAQVGNLAGILALFGRARTHLKNPAIVLGLDHSSRLIRITIAGDRAKHPGSLNVLDGAKQDWDANADAMFGSGREWFGRVHKDGALELKRTYQNTDLGDAIEAKLRAFAAEPAKVAAEHGRLTGRCCFCNRALTDERSTAVGYGKTCAGHFGLPWGEARTDFGAELALPFDSSAKAAARGLAEAMREDWEAERTERDMQRMEAEGDRAETIRDERNKHEARSLMELAARIDAR